MGRTDRKYMGTVLAGKARVAQGWRNPPPAAGHSRVRGSKAPTGNVRQERREPSTASASRCQVLSQTPRASWVGTLEGIQPHPPRTDSLTVQTLN